VTPRGDPHDHFELLSADTSSSMMETEESTNETATCGTAEKANYEITQEIGKGSWGAV